MASDKHITETVEQVMFADRGFDIAESVGAMQAKLHIPYSWLFSKVFYFRIF